MSNEERKRLSVKSSNKPMKKLKVFEEIVSDVESSQDERSQRGKRKTTKFIHSSQPVLGTPLKRKLHHILANWKPPTKKSQSSCNEDEKENMNDSPQDGVATDTDCAEVKSHSTDAPHTSMTDDTGPSESDVKADQNTTPHMVCSIKSGGELPQNVTPLPLRGEGSGLNEKKKEKSDVKSHDINHEDLKSKYIIDVPSKSIQQVNLILEKRDYVVKENEVEDSVDSPRNKTNEDEIANPTRSVKEHRSSTITDTKNTEKEHAEVTKVMSLGPQQHQSDILANRNISSSEQGGTKLTSQSHKRNILGNANNSNNLKVTSHSSQQFINNNNDPPTCMPSFNDIVALDQDESTQEIEHERSVTEENKVSYSGSKLIRETQSGNEKLIHNLVDSLNEPVNTRRNTDQNALYPTPHDARVTVPYSIRNQQLNESVMKKNELPVSVVEDDLCISDSQFESIERNFVSKLSTLSSVPFQLNDRRTSSSTSSSSAPFSPKMNHMQWVSQMRNDKRRLQGVVREISQLNAMLTRAIKEIWPTKK